MKTYIIAQAIWISLIVIKAIPGFSEGSRDSFALVILALIYLFAIVGTARKTRGALFGSIALTAVLTLLATIPLLGMILTHVTGREYYHDTPNIQSVIKFEFWTVVPLALLLLLGLIQYVKERRGTSENNKV